jgi:hypothetical protein
MRAGHARDQQTGAAVRLEHSVRADDGREPAGDLAHRGEQRKRPARQLHCLVGDGRDPGIDQRAGECLLGGEVKVGEENEPGAEVAVLALDRLLHLQHQVGGAPGARRVGEDGRARCDVELIGDGGSHPCLGLHVDLVAVRHEVMNAGRRDRHPEFVVLDFARDRDLHEAPYTSA